VLFFIYGGGFTEGSINVRLYDGAALARKGVIVVAANYRVGPTGFLSLADLAAESPHGSSSNYGLLDQIAALQWVQDNIRAFGGDPANVTIAGQSAGAVSAYLLTRSPLAAGLFHRAILASGPGALDSIDPLIARGAVPRAAAERDGLKFLGQAGVSSLAQLRAMDGGRLPPPGTPDPRSQGIRIWPVVDGWVLPADAQGALAAAPVNDVPLLIGLTADEGSMSPAYAGQRDQLRAANLASMRRFLSAHAASSRQPAYVYYFQHPIPWPENPQFGAYHSVDLPYVFDNLALLDRPWTAADHALATAVSSGWANFATTGKPAGGAIADWPAYSPDAPKWMVFADRPQLLDRPAP
jgi:para-nitrobenzyl esterase